MEFSKLTFVMFAVVLLQYGRTNEINYNIILTGLEYMNGTKDCCYDYTNLIFKDGDITGSVDLLIDITDDMTNYEGQILLLKKNEDTGELEPNLSLGPDPWCELYNKKNPLLEGLKQTADLPEKCPVSKGTYTVNKSIQGEVGDQPEDLPRGEYALDCTLIIDDQVVSGVRTYFKIADK